MHHGSLLAIFVGLVVASVTTVETLASEGDETAAENSADAKSVDDGLDPTQFDAEEEGADAIDAEAEDRRWLIPGPDAPPRRAGWFHLDHLGAYVEFGASYEQQRRRRKTSEPPTLFRNPSVRQTNTDWLIQEQLGFDLSGDIVNPNFLQFDGHFAFGLDHDYFREDLSGRPIAKDSDTGLLLDLDLTARFLQGRPVYGEAYARRERNRIARRFIPSLDEEKTLLGLSFYLRSDIVPMRLTIERELVDRDGGADRYDQEETSETRVSYEAEIVFTPDHTLSVTYEFSDLHEEIAGGGLRFDTRRHEWTLDDSLRFGDRKQHRLNTTLRYQEETGPLARDLFEFNPRLTLEHSTDLTSYLTYEFLRQRYETNGFQSHRGDYSLVRKFYDSLTTSLNVFGQHEEFDDDLRATTFGAGMRLDYRKTNPYGVLLAGVGYHWDQRRESAGDQSAIQVRESGTFRDPRPVLLQNQNVVTTSIVVTNPDRTRLYLPVRDYVISSVGSRTSLIRVSTGDIADGDTVLMFYGYKRRTRARIDNQRVDFRIEQQFTSGLRPYYEFNLRRQQVRQPDGQPLGLDEDDLTRHRVGIDYTQDRWSAGLEFESEDNPFDPFEAVHATGQWNFYQSERVAANLSGRYSHFDFDSPDDRDVDLLDVAIDGQFDINPRLSAQCVTAYRWENDSLDGVTHGVDVEGSLIYLLGATQIELTAEYDLLEIAGSADDGLGVWLRVRRNFGELLR